MNRPPEISQFQRVILPHKDVLRLDVPVDHVFFVQVQKSASHLAEIPLSSVFRELAFFPQNRIQLAPRLQLQQQVNFVLVVEIVVHPQTILVPQMALDLYLPHGLVLHVVLSELLFMQDFKLDQVAGKPVPSKVD